MTRYEQGFLNKVAEIKKADSLSDNELALLAKYYDTHRGDRPTFMGDIGRYLLTGGSLPLTAVYDYNRTGGTQPLARIFGNKYTRSVKRTQKQVDRANIIAKVIAGGLGSVVGATVANGVDPTGDNVAVGAVAGIPAGIALQHIVQKIAQKRARKHVDDIIAGKYDKVKSDADLEKEKNDREAKIKSLL